MNREKSTKLDEDGTPSKFTSTIFDYEKNDKVKIPFVFLYNLVITCFYI